MIESPYRFLNLKKKIIKFFAIVLFLISCPSYGAGPYDGIWDVSPFGYTIISEKDGVLIAVNVYNQEFDGDWEAFQGRRNGNAARMTAIVSQGSLTLDLVMTTDNTFTLTVVDCVPKNPSDTYCLVPNGTLLMEGKRVW